MYLRYHHLDQLNMLSDHFQTWKQVYQPYLSPHYRLPPGISDLTHNAEIGYSFILEEAKRHGRFIIEDIHIDGLQKSYDNYWHDYAGPHGEFLQNYVKEMNECFQHLLLSDPDTQVYIGYDPDGFCRSCQVKAENHEVGNHCIEDMGNLGDYHWEKILKKIQNPAIVRSETKPEYMTNIGILRQLADTGELNTYYKEAAIEISAEQSHLINEGFLIQEPLTGFLKVNTRYYRGERF